MTIRVAAETEENRRAREVLRETCSNWGLDFDAISAAANLDEVQATVQPAPTIPVNQFIVDSARRQIANLMVLILGARAQRDDLCNRANVALAALTDQISDDIVLDIPSQNIWPPKKP